MEYEITFCPARREAADFLPGELVTGIYQTTGDEDDTYIMVVPDDGDWFYLASEGVQWTGPWAYDPEEWIGWSFTMGGDGTKIEVLI